MMLSRRATSAVRPPAVAGLFYPASAAALREVVDRNLAETTSTSIPHDDLTSTPFPSTTPKAILAPHAGYPYSGPVAGSAFRPLSLVPTTESGTLIQRVVVIGPSHRVAFSGVALPRAEAFETPLGEMRVDRSTLDRLSRLRGVSYDDRPHVDEHSIEVELPFLQRVLDETPLLVPLVVGRASPDTVSAVLDAAWGGAETLIVISSDLSHFLPYDRAAAIDRDTVETIVEGRRDLRPDQACGAAAINGFQRAADRRALRPVLLDLRSSGDTAGDRDRVVGYGAIAFYPAES